MQEGIEKIISETLTEYSGKYQDILSYMPAMLRLIERIYHEIELPFELKMKLNCGLSYLVVSADIINDDSGAEGYLDDFYMLCYVLDEIGYVIPGVIERLWDGSGNPILLIRKILDRLSAIIDGNIQSILDVVALREFHLLCERQVFASQFKPRNSELSALNAKRSELIRLLRAILVKEGGMVYRRGPVKLQHCKEQFDDAEWESVIDILQQMKLQERVYDRRTEALLEDIRREVLLSIDASLKEGDDGA